MVFAESVLESLPIKVKYLELKNHLGNMTYPISDMLNRIKSSQAVSLKTVVVPFSNFKFEVAKIMEREGFLDKVEKKGKKEKRFIEISLKYKDKEPVISGIKVISKPGQRIYMKSGEIRSTRGKYGLTIISSPKGLITNKESRRNKLGGEVIAEIW